MYFGEKALLRPFELGDEAILYRWYSDAELRRDLATGGIYSSEGCRRFVESSLVPGFESGAAHFMVVSAESGLPVGFCGLRDLMPLHRTAEAGLTICDRSDRGLGIGAEAGLLLARYGFWTLDLRKLYFVTSNESVVWGAQRVGAKVEGVLRAARWIHGGPVDMKYLGLLREEFEDRDPHGDFE